ERIEEEDGERGEERERDGTRRLAHRRRVLPASMEEDHRTRRGIPARGEAEVAITADGAPRRREGTRGSRRVAVGARLALEWGRRTPRRPRSKEARNDRPFSRRAADRRARGRDRRLRRGAAARRAGVRAAGGRRRAAELRVALGVRPA